MLLSLVLFGSRARGDHRLSSDVDLLGVVEGGQIMDEVASRGASFYRYPVATLMEKAKGGDLFVLHLVKEGKVLHDTAGIFENIANSFVYKKSYASEIREASAVAWLITLRPNVLGLRKNRKRLVWAIRTMLIAHAAQQGSAVFSSAALSDYAGMPELKVAIDRRFTVNSGNLISIAEAVANSFGVSQVDLAWPINKRDQLELVASAGSIGKATVDSLAKPRKQSVAPLVAAEPYH